MSTVDVVFLILAATAIALPFAIERIKRPRIELEPRPWTPRSPVPWTFAAVWIRNKPLTPILRWLFVREIAAASTVQVAFRRRGELVFPEISARWSSRPEPQRTELQLSDEEQLAITEAAQRGEDIRALLFPRVFDPALVQPSLRLDLAPGTWEEVAVAILRDDGEAFAFTAESYRFPYWGNPEWALERGQYDVTIRVESGGITATAEYTLDNLAADFAHFRLSPRNR